MTREDLLPFCDEKRLGMFSPFSVGDFTYATDHKVVVRVPRVADVGPIKTAPNVVGLFAQQFRTAGEGVPLPEELPPLETKPCPECDGAKRIKVCPFCDGSGEVECDMGHKHNCPDCESKGKVPSWNDFGDACGACQGRGVKEGDSKLQIGHWFFSVLSLRKLHKLPGLRLFPDNHAATNRGTACFIFAGGSGLIQSVGKAGGES